MYILCALMLFPIVIWKNIIAKTKRKKVKKQEEKERKRLVEENTTENSLIKNIPSFDNILCLSSIDQVDDIIHEESETLFDFYDLSDLNQNIRTEINNNDLLTEPDHILNSKPWLLNDKPLTDTKINDLDFSNKISVFSLPSSNVAKSKNIQKIKKEVKFKLLSTNVENIEEHNYDLTKSNSNCLLFESNV